MESKRAAEMIRDMKTFAAGADGEGHRFAVAMEAGAEAIELLEWYLENQWRVVIMASKEEPFIVQLDRQTVGRFDTRIDCLRRAKKASDHVGI